MKLLDIKNPLEELIKVNVTAEELDERLKSGIKGGVVGGEQWFRKFHFWYSTPAYANPYKTPFEELPLLLKKERTLRPFLAKTVKIYYGLGIGDTEIVPIWWDLSLEKCSEIYAVDVIKDFIENFIQGLRNLTYIPQFYTSHITFLGNNILFEKLTEKDFIFEETQYTRRFHICFGNTIGNFDQETIFSILDKGVKPGDYLLLGYQLNEAKSDILKQYRGNFRFTRLISACFKDYPELKSKNLNWNYNEENDTVEAWIDKVLVFRSKKYSKNTLEEAAGRFGLQVVRRKFKDMHFKHDLVGISVMEKA